MFICQGQIMNEGSKKEQSLSWREKDIIMIIYQKQVKGLTIAGTMKYMHVQFLYKLKLIFWTVSHKCWYKSWHSLTPCRQSRGKHSSHLSWNARCPTEHETPAHHCLDRCQQQLGIMHWQDFYHKYDSLGWLQTTRFPSVMSSIYWVSLKHTKSAQTGCMQSKMIECCCYPFGKLREKLFCWSSLAGFRVGKRNHFDLSGWSFITWFLLG